MSGDINDLPKGLVDMIREMDRNARAFGWEIGRGQEMTGVISISPDNPFLYENWRDKIQNAVIHSVLSCSKVTNNEVHAAHSWVIDTEISPEGQTFWCDGVYGHKSIVSDNSGS